PGTSPATRTAADANFTERLNIVCFSCASFTSSRVDLLACRDRVRSLDLSHQVMIPLAFHHEVTCGAQLEGLDQVVVHVGVHARLLEGVERRTGRTARDEPRFHVAQGRVMELAMIPDPVAMTTDQVRTGIAVGLRVNDQHRRAYLR